MESGVRPQQLNFSIRMFQKVIGILLTLFISVSAFAQETDALDAISALENNGKVYLRWTMKSGSTCNGIRIYRSTDSLNFNVIGQINGICGSTTESISYTFTDENPSANKINFYTVELGSLGFSKVISVEVIDFFEPVLVRPNPVIDKVEFLYKNNTLNAHRIQIINFQGKIMYEVSDSDDRFSVNFISYPSGLYFYRIYNKDNQVVSTGRVMKQ